MSAVDVLSSYRSGWAAANVFVVTAADGHFVFIGSAAASVLDATEAELLGRPLSEVVALDRPASVEEDLSQAAAGLPVLRLEARLAGGGNARALAYSLAPLRDAGPGPNLLLGAVAVPGTGAAAEVAQLRRERQLREVLVAEVYHRIKNNLQGVIGLLRAHALDHPAAAPALEEAVSQVNSVASAYGLKAERQGHLALSELIADVAGNVQEIWRRGGGPQLVLAEAVNVGVSDRELVPLALCLNELIFNAYKHSPDDATVAVRVEAVPGGVVVVVRNERGELPPGFSMAAGKGLGRGLRLVRSLLPATAAEMELVPDGNGVIARLLLRAPIVCWPAG